MSPRRPAWRPKDIFRLTEEILTDYALAKGWTEPNQYVFNLKDIYEEAIYPRYEIIIREDIPLGWQQRTKLLGKAICGENTALIDPSIAEITGDNRYIFTLAHEFGHLILHKDSTYKCHQMDSRTIFQKEKEANLFAEALLMPLEHLKRRVEGHYHLKHPWRYMGRGKYCFTWNGITKIKFVVSYTQFCQTVAAPLTGYFCNVSTMAMALRIHKLGWIFNRSAETFMGTATDSAHLMSTALAVTKNALVTSKECYRVHRHA